MSEGATKARRTRSDEEESVARAIVDAALEVHRAIGPGFLESVYEEALAHELTLRGVPFVRQPVVEIGYKGHRVGEGRLDALADIHTAQALSYLKATGLHLALLINFNAPLLKTGLRRLVL